MFYNLSLFQVFVTNYFWIMIMLYWKHVFRVKNILISWPDIKRWWNKVFEINISFLNFSPFGQHIKRKNDGLFSSHLYHRSTLSLCSSKYCKPRFVVNSYGIWTLNLVMRFSYKLSLIWDITSSPRRVEPFFTRLPVIREGS